VGTAAGLFTLRNDGHCETHDFAERSITALGRAANRWWALVEGAEIWSAANGRQWQCVAVLAGARAHCIVPLADGLLIGTSEARLYRLRGRRVHEVESFLRAPARDSWYTPWGAPADVRSLSRGAEGILYVNVHVGGVVRSINSGRTWEPTVDIDADVHQVLAHPHRRGWVFAASARGLGVSEDGGETWRFESQGLHARYQRALAFTRTCVLVSTSISESGRQAAVYRRALDAPGFARCESGLPLWFADNVNTACLAAAGTRTAIGTADGRVFLSADEGATWSEIRADLPKVRCVAFAA
jgi:hypothetical protein